MASWLDGWRRALRAPVITLGVLAATAGAAVPLAVVVGHAIESDLGRSAQATEAAAGWNADWATEFAGRADGVARTFTHEIIGFGGSLATVSRFLDDETLNPAVAMAAAGYLGLWMFLWGGILDRFARQRPIRAAAFFSACGVFFWRFLRLGVVVGALYWIVLGWLHPLLFGTLYGWWTRDLTVEREAVALRAALYLVFVAALATVGLISDMAKVRTVVEDRRSMLGAFAASVRFVRRRAGRLVGLYVLNAVALTVIAAIWFFAAPGAAVSAGTALLVTQIYLLVRIWTRLALAAAEVSFFQSELAHAEYAAVPMPVWPDSPTVEALKRLRPQ